MRLFAPLLLLMLAAPLFARAAESDLSKYRTGVVDPALARVSSEVRQKIFTEPEQQIDRLVAELVAGERDSFRRVKIIHDWIAEHIAYDAQSFLANRPVDSAWTATLRSKKSVCQGYSALLKTMCERAGIECVQISGFARGFGFTASVADVATVENHAWNAVKIEGQWYLLDVTWNAGTVSARGFEKAFNHAYLFLKPREFLYTHFPRDAKWQLITPQLTAQRFTELPNLKGRFFAHGLRLVSRVGSHILAKQSLRLSLKVPREIVISAKLRTAEGEAAPRRTLLQRTGDDCSLLVLFPQAGRYELELFCKPRRDAGSLLLAATFDIEASAGTERTFPRTFSIYHELPASLEEPLLLPLDRGASTNFRVRVPGAQQVLVSRGKQPWVALERDPKDGDLFTAQVSIGDEPEVKLMVRRPGDGRSMPTLIDFSSP